MEMSSISLSSYESLSSFELNPQLKDEVYSVVRQIRERQKTKMLSRRWQKLAIAGMLIWIVGVSTYDMYWSFKTQEVLIDYEENPLGTLLINADNGDIALFMTLKALGNVIVLVTIPLLYMYKRWWGLTVASSLSIGQLMLFMYLNWGHLLTVSM